MVVALVGLFYCGSKCQQETNERKWEAERSTPSQTVRKGTFRTAWGQDSFVFIRTYGVEMSREVPGSTRAPTPDFGVYSIGGGQ